MDAALTNHVLSSLFHLLAQFVLFLSISIEAYIFFNKWDPTYHLLPLSCILMFPTLQRLFSRTNHVYLVDFACLRPPPRFRVPTSALLEHLSLINRFDQESIAFMTKVITTSGLGEETYFPPPLHYIPPKTQHLDCIFEAEYLLFPALDDLLLKTGLAPTEIDILVVNCSGFCPSPSLSAMVVNRYSMRDDIKTFSLSGMGCSAGAISIDVARGVLHTHPGSYAVVLSTEILSTGWYNGKDRRKLLLNCVFRSGSAAVLLTNRRDARGHSRYRLTQLVRTHRAFDDRAYRAAFREEDMEGINGFSIERDLLRVVAETLRSNVVDLGNSILPPHEKLRYALAWILSVMVRTSEKGQAPAPDFGSVVQHYCMPSSGRGVIEEIGRGLGVGELGTEAARMAFRRFGNQSSSSMWYQLAYAEAKGRVMAGDRVWMLAMGSGVKCNSVVWECMRPGSATEAEVGPWADCIHRYPLVDDGEGRKHL